MNAGHQSILATSSGGIWFRQPSNRQQFDLFAMEANPGDQAAPGTKMSAPIATAPGASAATLPQVWRERTRDRKYRRRLSQQTRTPQRWLRRSIGLG